MDKNTNNAAGVGKRVRRQYWQRVEEALLPWWPSGLLPLLGLIALFFWGVLLTAPNIETDVSESVANELAQADVELTKVDASGQHVRIVAVAPPTQVRAIRAIAKSTVCDTWAGELTCPNAVEVVVAEPEPVASEPMLETTVAGPRPHNFLVSVDADRVATLSGEVPDEISQRHALEFAQARFESVIDRLKVSNEAASTRYNAAIIRALKLLDPLNQGEARWQDGRLSLSGVASRADENALRSAFTPGSDGLVLGELTLTLIDDNAACNKSINELMQTSTISFASGSAVVAEASSVQLQQLAALVQQCSGIIVVEGHTDNTGNPASNLTLSEQRAKAVGQKLIDFGVPEEIVETRGFGADRPVADNNTPAGRKANRRIIIQAVDPSSSSNKEKES